MRRGRKAAKKAMYELRSTRCFLFMHFSYLAQVRQRGQRRRNSKKCARHRDEAAARVGAHITLV
jgi:hypothetical protein